MMTSAKGVVLSLTAAVLVGGCEVAKVADVDDAREEIARQEARADSLSQSLDSIAGATDRLGVSVEALSDSLEDQRRDLTAFQVVLEIERESLAGDLTSIAYEQGRVAGYDVGRSDERREGLLKGYELSGRPLAELYYDPLGWLLEGSVDRATEPDPHFYQLDLLQEQPVRIVLRGTVDIILDVLRLDESTVTAIASEDDAPHDLGLLYSESLGNYNRADVEGILPAGSYIIVPRAYGSGGRYRYELEIQFVDSGRGYIGYETEDDERPLGEISLGETTAGVLDELGDFDVYELELTEEAPLYIAAGTSVGVEVWSEGNYVTGLWETASAAIPPGRYAVRVYGSPGASYEFSVEPGEVMDLGSVSIDDALTGVLGTGQTARYSFTAALPTRVYIEDLQSSLLDGQLSVELWSEDGGQFLTGLWVDEGEPVILVPGTYQVRLVPFASAQEFDLRLRGAEVDPVDRIIPGEREVFSGTFDADDGQWPIYVLELEEDRGLYLTLAASDNVTITGWGATGNWFWMDDDGHDEVDLGLLGYDTTSGWFSFPAGTYVFEISAHDPYLTAPIEYQLSVR